MRLFLSALFSCVASLCFAQVPLHVMFSRAPLPEWVNDAPYKTLAKIKAQKARQGWKLDGNSTNSLVQANEAQYNYLAGGRLLFNDEAGSLANTIVDKLLASDTALRNSVNLCVYYSSGTDLICFPNGFIVVELGLFAQLENEDQLAFLIAHELAHLKNGDFTTSETPWRPEEWSVETDKYTEYRRTREVEADLLAYELYEKAGYSPLQALRVFDVIERNWIVPVALPFSSVLFTDSLFQYPASYATDLDKCSDPVSMSELEGTTQELYYVRRSKLAAYHKLDSVTIEVKLPAGEFEKVNKLAIYNCGLLALEDQDFACALYLGYYLHQSDSSVRDEAGLLMAKAIYLNSAMLSPETENKHTVESEVIRKPEKFGNLFFWANNEEDPEDLRGHAAGAKAFFGHLSQLESMILSVRWCWDYSQQTVRHGEIARELAANSVSILNLKIDEPTDSLGHIQLSYRWSEKWDEDDDEEEDEEDNTNAELEEMIKLAELYGQDISDKIDSAKAEIKRRKAKRDAAGIAKATVPSTPEVSTQLLTATRDTAFIAFYKKSSRPSVFRFLEDKPNAEHLSADSVYLMGSNHIWAREYKRTYDFDVKPEKTKQSSEQLRKNFQVTARSTKIKLLSAEPLEPDTITLDDYNQFALSRRVFSEIIGYGTERFTYPIVYKEEFDSVVAITHVTHAVADLAITKQYTKIRQPGLWIVGVIFPYSSPIALLWVVPPRKFTFHQTAVYNLQTGNVDWTWVETGKGSGGTNHCTAYYGKIFKKIRKPKKKPASASPAR